jgi:RsiW-degrading membrane proteinase PrsW (M82 family)
MGWALLAVVFALVWGYAFYREDARNREPLWMVALAAGGGMLAFPLAWVVEGWLLRDAAALEGSLATRAAASFLVAGPVEEAVKFLAVLLLVWPWSHFDEPVDGLVYAAAAGAGFALVENLRFMEGQPQVILARGPAGTGAHVLFAALWGGALGYARDLPRRAPAVAIGALGLLIAALAHGAFDMITLTADRELSLTQARAGQITLFVLCALFLRWRLRAARATVPVEFGRKAG